MDAFKIKPEIEITVTQQLIDDIISTAYEDGLCWCHCIEKSGKWLGDFAGDHINNGGTLKLYDDETDDVFELNLGKLKHGLILFLESEDVSFEVNEGKLDIANMDACDVDSIIQFALFEKIEFC